MLKGADKAIRTVFQTFSHAVGLYGYHLPDMNEIAELALPTTTTTTVVARRTWRSAS